MCYSIPMNGGVFVKRSQEKLHRAWLVCLGCSISLATVMGLGVNAFTVYQPWILEVNGFPNAFGSWITTVRSLFALLAMVTVDQLCRRLGLRVTMTFGMACFAASCVLFSTAGSSFLVYCQAAALSGLAYGFGGMIPLTLVISQWFQGRRGLALGLAAAGSGVTTILAPPLLNMLIVGRGLSFAFLAEGAAALGLTLLVFFLVRDTPQEMGLEPYGLQDGSHSAPIHVKPKNLTRPMWWGAFLACFFIGGPSGPGFSHLTVLYTASGYPPMLTALLMSYVGLVLMAGKVLYGGLVDARGSRWANRMVFLVFLAGFLLNCLAPLQNMFLAFAAVTATGLGLPISSVTLSVWAGDLSGQEDYDRTVKWFTSAYMLGSLVTGPIPGLMADHLGSYVPAYFLFAVLTALAMAIIQGLYRRLHLGLLPK